MSDDEFSTTGQLGSLGTELTAETLRKAMGKPDGFRGPAPRCCKDGCYNEPAFLVGGKTYCKPHRPEGWWLL